VIEPVEIVAAYEVVAEQIRRAIYFGTYMVDSKLPPERVLAQQLGVSRTTLREALRVLETQGFLESRRGAAGGLIVQLPQEEPERVKRRLRDHLDIFEEMLEFRLVVECAVSRLAALRRSEEDLTHLQQTLDAMHLAEGLPQFRAADHAFHLAIADAARNHSLQKAVQDARISMFTFVDILPSSELMYLAQRNDHSHILAAIQMANPQEADEAMAAHIVRTRQQIRLTLGIEEE
jgi:DNA-binding FadR family transcriptional regulator